VRFYLIIFLNLLIFFSARGQEAERVPEFLKQYHEATADSSKIYALSWAAYHSAYSNPELGVKYGRDAVAIAVKTKDERQLANVYNSMGLCFDAWGKADSSEQYYRKSIAILEKMGLACEAANALGNVGNLQRKNNRFLEALKTYSEVMAVQESCEDKRYYGATLHSIGACYNAMRDFDKSIQYFQKAYEAGEKFNDSTLMCNAHYGAANAYLVMNQLDKAREKYLFSLKCYENLGNIYQVAYAYEGLSQLAGREEKIDSALMYCNEAMKIYEKIGSDLDKLYILELTAGHQIHGKRYRDAKKTLQEAVKLFTGRDGPQEQRIINDLSQTEAELGNYKEAYHYLMRANFLSDSLRLDDEKSELKSLANKYETDTRDRQIELEQSQKKILQAEHNKQKQQKYFFLIGFILLTLLVMGLIHRYVQKQRTTKLLEEQNKRIEEEKLRAEKSERVKQQFLANMSHEIRTPVNAINGLSRSLLKKSHDEKTSTYIKAIHHSGENLLVVLNDILDLSKMEAGKLSVQEIPFELRAEVDALVQIFSQSAAEKSLSFHLEYDAALPQLIMGDSARIVQVIQNLLSNAIKFTNEGSVTFSLKKQDDTLQIAVKDTGVGIPYQQQQNIFQEFVQVNNQHSRSHSGSGLGLAITKRLVELMGGTIILQSEEENGSVFTVELPLKEASQQRSSQPSIASNEKPLHIIVAEDNEYNYWVTQGTLQAFFPKAQLYRATNGYEVLSFLEEDDYDLILMDIQMPQLDGLETTKQIRAANHPIPIIGLTASVIKEEVDECLRVGMSDYVMKPFKEEELIAVLNKVLQLKPSSLNFKSSSEMDGNRLQEYKRAIPDRLAVISAAMEMNDKRSAALAIHNLRPLLLRLGFAYLEQQLIEVECADELDDGVKAKWKCLLDEIKTGLEEA
jgi:signal transduction histidine kinase/DNA-binding response OmpR family regulator